MADIKLDIEVNGTRDLKQAADQMLRTGSVSRKLAKDFSATAAANSRLVTETRRVEAVKKQLRKAVQDEIITSNQATRALNEEIRKSKERVLTDKTLIDQAKKRKKAEEEARKETQRLIRTYAPARAAQDLLRKKTIELTQAMKRGVIQKGEARQALALLNKEYYDFTQGVATGGNQFAKFNVETYKTTQRLKRFTSVGLQQAGYQVGDFAVQLQSGTNAAVALGQQGSQLLGIFGPAGALAGAGLAIATALVAPFFKAKKEAEDFTKELDNLSGVLSDLEAMRFDSGVNSFKDIAVEARQEFENILAIMEQVKYEQLDESIMAPMRAIAQELQAFDYSKLSPFATETPEFKSKLGFTTENQAEFVGQQLSRLRGIYDPEELRKEFDAVVEAIRFRFAFEVPKGVKEMLTKVGDQLGIVDRLQLEITEGTEKATERRTEDAKRRLKEISDSATAMEKELGDLAAFNSRTAQNEAAAANKLRVVQDKANAAALAFIKRRRNANILALGDEADQLISNANQALDLDEKVAAEKRNNAIETANFNFSLVEGLLGTLQKEQEALNKSAEELGLRLGISYAEAIKIIRDAQAEATVGLDAFGGAGDFKYSVPTTFSPDKDGKSGRTLKNIQDTIDALREQTDQETKLLALTGERLKEEEVFYDLLQANKDADIKLSEEKLRAIAKEIAAQQQANEMYKEAIGFVDGMTDVFSDFIANGLKDFKDFVGSIKDMFIRLLADMAAAAIRNRILIPIATGFMGGFGNAAAASAMGGFTGSAATMAGTAASFGSGLQAGIQGFAGGFAGGGGIAGGISGYGATLSATAANAGVAATLGAAVPMIAAGVALFSIFGKKKKPDISPENMNKVVQALKMTGQEFEGTRKEAGLAAKALGEVAGGFDKLTKKAQAYFESFYTEGERRAIAATEATEALNKTFADLELTVPKTHAEFRQLVEAQDLMTDAGRKTYNALLDVSGAFVTLKGTAEQANEAIKLERARELEQRAKKALPLTERFVAQEMINQQIETLGTTAELNEFLLRGLDSYLSIANVPAYARKEQLERVKEQLDGFLEDTTYVQNIQREFYEGLKKPIQEVKNMLKQVGGSKQDMAQYERYGDISGDLMDKLTERFGKYFEYNVLPYTTQLELFIKDQVSRVIGPLVEAIDLTNFRGDLGVINKKIEVSANRVVAGYQALASGYRKIVEAVDKVEAYYEKDFAALRAEYSGASGLESSTAVKSIADRISSIIELPKQLVAVIERSMDTLSKQADKLDGAFIKVQQEYFKVKYSGQQVSEGLQESYRDMLADRQAAAQAAAEAQKRIEELTLFIGTIEGAVQGFKDSVERVVTSPIEDALAVFLPTELDSLAQNVRTQIKEILGSMGEGTLDTFETGLVTLSDLLASNTITVDQFNNSFKLMQDVFEGNLSLTEQYTTKQQTVIEKLSRAYDDFTSRLQNLLGVVQGGIDSLLGQATSANVVASRRGSQAYLRTVARTGEFDAARLERAVGAVSGGDTAGFGSRQDFLRYVADTTNVLNAVKGTLEGQLDTLQMKQVKSILKIEETSTSSAESLQSIQSLLAEFLGVGGRVPSFAAGGYHSGGLRIVGERGPELEATGPSRIIPAGEFAVGGVSALRQEIAEMKDQLYNGLVQVAKYTRKSSETLNKFDYDGLPSDRGY